MLKQSATAAPVLTNAAPAGSDAHTARVREALLERLQELREEHAHSLSDLAILQRDRVTETAGDDAADMGTKTFAHEQELALVATIREKIDQVEHALERLSVGGYGRCEGCQETIPAARLAAFPAATLCVTCKSNAERR